MSDFYNSVNAEICDSLFTPQTATGRKEVRIELENPIKSTEVILSFVQSRP